MFYAAGLIECTAKVFATVEWSAKQYDANRPFGSWADDLAAAFVQLEPRQIVDLPFQGTILRKDADAIRVSRVTATKHRVLRLRSHIARSTDDLCFINLQFEGMGRYLQRGHVQICGPGDMALVDTAEPFEIVNCRDFRLLCSAPAFVAKLSCNASTTKNNGNGNGGALSRTLVGYAELCFALPHRGHQTFPHSPARTLSI
jgi:AraC family transcriptional regulator, positive regulator of tynA and feaB